MARICNLMCIMVLLLGALAARGEASQTVLFDNGHGERFLIGNTGPLQLSGLAAAIQAGGVKVATLEQPISDDALAGADALVVSGAFAPLAPGEIEALLRFMERGGRLAVMLHIAPPLATLLDRLSLTYTNGVIREYGENIIDGEALNFRVSHFGNHPVFKGIKRISLHGAWGLINTTDRASIVASCSPNAWIDLQHDNIQKKENTAAFGVVGAGDYGKGGFLVFGDDAIFQNKFLEGDNKVLAANLARWLSGR